MDSRPVIAAALLALDKEFARAHHGRVDPKDFPDGPLQDIVLLALHCFEQYETPLTETILETYLDEIDDEDTVDDLRELYQRLTEVIDEDSLPALRSTAEEWLEARFIARAIEEAREAIKRGNRDEALAALARAERAEKQIETRVELSTALGRLVAIKRDDEVVPTGIEEIDNTLEGGLRPGELGVILASTNTGKSMILSYFAAHALLAGKLVLYYSSELTVEQVVARTVAAIFRKPIRDVQANAGVYMQALEEVKESIGGHLFIDEMPNSIRSIVADIRELERIYCRPDVIILDTPDDLRPSKPYPTLYLALADIYTDLRAKLANNLKLVVWASSQTNRDAVDRARLSLRYIGDSFAKAQRAHVVLGLVQTEQEQRAPFAPTMRIVLLKDTLHGRRGTEWRFNVTFGREDTPGYPGFILDDGG